MKTDRQTDRQMNPQRDGQTDGWTNISTKLAKNIGIEEPYHLATPITKLAFRKTITIYFNCY